jgi:hypothetical protein
MRWLFFLLLLLTPLYPQEDGGNSESQLYLSLNINDGAILQLSDGTTYEIAPNDRLYSAYWITPFPLSVGASGDPDYPIKTEIFLQRENRLEKDAKKESSFQPPLSPDEKTPAQKQTTSAIQPLSQPPLNKTSQQKLKAESSKYQTVSQQEKFKR